MLSELESQNEDQVNGILGKVKVLKDVSLAVHPRSDTTQSIRV